LNKEILNSDKNKNYTQKIIFEVESMKKILIDFLDFARPNSPQPDKCSITAIIEDVRNMLRLQIEKKHISIQTEIRNDRIIIDPAHFRQIVTNILENSIQSIESDKGQIVIKSKLTDDHIQINIIDNGAGIDEKIKDKIFDPFFTTKEKGSGLGLAIVKKLVDENNGDIMIISNPSKGSDCQLIFYKQSDRIQ
jgi:signal transduction histidine kinase